MCNLISELLPTSKMVLAKKYERKYKDLLGTQAVSLFSENNKIYALVYSRVWLNNTKRKVIYVPACIESNVITIIKKT